MKLMFSDKWKVIGVLDNKIKLQSLQHANECCLIDEVKFVNRLENKTMYYRISNGVIEWSTDTVSWNA